MLDQLIDEIAREHTAGQPPEAFAAGVMRRIASFDAGAISRSFRTRRLIALATAAALLIAVWLFHPKAPDSGRPALPSRPIAFSAAPPNQVARAVASADAPPGTVVRRVVAAGGAVNALDPLVVAPMLIPPMDVAELARPDLIALDSIGIENIDITPLQ